MIAEKERNPRRIILDFHDNSAENILHLTESHYPTMPFTRAEAIRLQELRRKKDLDTVRSLIFPVSSHAPVEAIPCTKTGSEKLDIGNLPVAILHWLEYIGQYQLTPDAWLGLREFHERGYKITLASGTRACCGKFFQHAINRRPLGIFTPFAEFLDPEDSVLLTPVTIPEGIWPTPQVSPIASKLIDAVYFEIIDGQVPIVIDDVTEIDELAGRLLGANTCNRRTHEEIERCRAMFFPENLKDFEVEIDAVRIIGYKRFSRLVKELASERWTNF